MKCGLLLLIFIAIKAVRTQWNVWMPRDISAMTNSCVVIPCSFMYPSGIRPYRGVHGIWYFGQPYPQLFPPVVFKSRTDIVHESYKGRTKLLGDLHQKNCTLKISNIGPEHSGKYYFRADLGGANIYTYPDFSELKVLDQPNVDVPDEIVSDDSLDLTCYAPDNCPDMTPEIHWMYTDYLPDPLFTADYLEDSNTAVISSTLTFTPKPMHHGQLIGCRVHYPNTTFVYEHLISLDIKYAPQTVWVNVSQEVMEGSSVVLHCEVDSNPVSRISWLFGEEELMSDTASNISLYMDDLDPTQEGIYTCVGDNGYGIMNTSMYLAVKYPPRDPWVNNSVTVLEGSSVHVHCKTQGNPVPTLTWLKDGELVGTIRADELSVLELLDLTPHGSGQYRCLAENEHGRSSSSLNITVEFAPVLLDESKCTVVREGVQCVCMATGNPEPVIEFYLPDLNITINETENRFNYYTHTDGHTSTGMIKLRDKSGQGTGIHVHCSITNIYGTETVQLELQQEKKYMMAVIVGTIGGVAVIAFIIAAVRYVGHSNKKSHDMVPVIHILGLFISLETKINKFALDGVKENDNPGQDLVSKLENPSMFYSAVKKDKHSLRKKVLKTELLGSKFNSILEESATGEEGDYQSVGSLAGFQRPELNYAALDFIRGRPREGRTGKEDDNSDYTEIKSK